MSKGCWKSEKRKWMNEVKFMNKQLIDSPSNSHHGSQEAQNEWKKATSNSDKVQKRMRHRQTFVVLFFFLIKCQSGDLPALVAKSMTCPFRIIPKRQYPFNTTSSSARRQLEHKRRVVHGCKESEEMKPQPRTRKRKYFALWNLRGN